MTYLSLQVTNYQDGGIIASPRNNSAPVLTFRATEFRRPDTLIIDVNGNPIELSRKNHKDILITLTGSPTISIDESAIAFHLDKTRPVQPNYAALCFNTSSPYHFTREKVSARSEKQ